MNAFNYIFSIGGNFEVKLQGMSDLLGKFNATITQSTTAVERITKSLLKFNIIFEGIQSSMQALSQLSAPLLSLDQSLHELSAITGVAGAQLKEIEGYARSTAKAFGIDAAGAVESYKLLLSQLSPELARQPQALQAMGQHVATLSKLMGGDATAATEVLTTAMNQYGVDLSDPTKASEEMAKMMNVMAAASREGSAELPRIKEALSQAGMASKMAGVSFEEANAAIQVLDKAGKKGSEGGVALRNVLSTLAQGRFLPKDVQKDLLSAGININTLSDKGKNLSERLSILKPLLNDSALLTKLFGKENANAAMALIQGTEQMALWHEAITDTNTAQMQAATIMESYNEKQARIRQQFEDFKITLMGLAGDFGIWATTISESLVPFGQLVPLLKMVYDGFAALIPLVIRFSISMLQASKSLAISLWQRFSGVMSLINTQLMQGKIQSMGFAGGMLRALVAVVRFSTVGLWNGLKALGAYILSLVTGGATSASFAGIASASFAAFKTSAVMACRSVSIAISSIPLVGWIAIAITALGALGVYLWNKSVRFRAVLKGSWAYVRTIFTSIWELAKNIFGGISDLIIAAFSLDADGISKAIDRMTGAMSTVGEEAAKAYQEAYDEELQRSKEKKEGSEEDKTDLLVEEGNSQTKMLAGLGRMQANPTGNTLSTIGGGATSSGGTIKHITITIDKLIDRFEIRTTNLKEDSSQIKELVAQALVSAVNDVSIA